MLFLLPSLSSSRRRCDRTPDKAPLVQRLLFRHLSRIVCNGRAPGVEEQREKAAIFSGFLTIVRLATPRRDGTGIAKAIPNLAGSTPERPPPATCEVRGSLPCSKPF
jgi:hypothetical protein